MNELTAIPLTDLETITGGRLQEPPGGDFNLGAGGEAHHKTTLRDRIEDWVKWNQVFPYKP